VVRATGAGYRGGVTLDAAPDAQPRRPGPVTRVRAYRHGPGGPPSGVAREEYLATEEPLEVRVGDRRVAVTMRTPGNDFELAAGWLFSEGLVGGHADVRSVRYCTDVELEPDERFNVVTVDLAEGVGARGVDVARSFVVSSACGVCGRETLDDLHVRGYAPAAAGAGLRPDLLAGLPDRLRERQSVFDRTGGLHAAGLVDVAADELVAVREDVGRHNAVDKVVGGRASYELCQKAVGAGLVGLVSVSAPSSLAVQVAREFGLLLAGFARDGRVTVYAGDHRLAAD